MTRSETLLCSPVEKHLYYDLGKQTDALVAVVSIYDTQLCRDSGDPDGVPCSARTFREWRVWDTHVWLLLQRQS